MTATSDGMRSAPGNHLSTTALAAESVNGYSKQILLFQRECVLPWIDLNKARLLSHSSWRPPGSIADFSIVPCSVVPKARLIRRFRANSTTNRCPSGTAIPLSKPSSRTGSHSVRDSFASPASDRARDLAIASGLSGTYRREGGLPRKETSDARHAPVLPNRAESQLQKTSCCRQHASIDRGKHAVSAVAGKRSDWRRGQTREPFVLCRGTGFRSELPGKQAGTRPVAHIDRGHVVALIEKLPVLQTSVETA